MRKTEVRSSVLALTLALATLTPCKTAEQRVGMDRLLGTVRSDIQRMTGCRNWVGSEERITCLLPQTRASLDLIRDPDDGSIETAEILAVAAVDPRQPAEERESLHTVTHIVQLLVPTWRQAPDWLAKAADRATNSRHGSTIAIGRLTVLVRWVPTADILGTFILVVVTKQTSLDRWSFGN